MKTGKPVAVVVHANTLVGRCADGAARARGYRVIAANRPAVATGDARKVEAFARRLDKESGAGLLIVSPAFSPLRDKSGSALKGNDKQWGSVVEALALPAMLFAAAFGKRMRGAATGRILFLISNSAVEPRRAADGRWLGATAYSAGMAAVASLTRQLAAEFGDSGVLVNGIVYGAVQGDEPKASLAGYALRTPLGRPLTPKELQNSMDLFLDPACGYVTGQNMVVDGGASIW